MGLAAPPGAAAPLRLGSSEEIRHGRGCLTPAAGTSSSGFSTGFATETRGQQLAVQHSSQEEPLQQIAPQQQTLMPATVFPWVSGGKSRATAERKRASSPGKLRRRRRSKTSMANHGT